MPLGGTGNQLGTEILAAVKSATGNTSHPQDALTLAIWQAIGTAIVNHITANAVVVQPNDSNGDTESPGTIT